MGATLIIGLIVAVLLVPAWLVMLALGALAGWHDFYSPSFWDTYLSLFVIGAVGSAFNGVKYKSS